MNYNDTRIPAIGNEFKSFPNQRPAWLFCLLVPKSKHDHGTRKRSTACGLPEPEPSTQEAEILRPGDIVMPPACIGARRKQGDDRCPATRRRMGFGHPAPDSPPVGWIHPADAAPLLRKPVIFRGVEAGALGVFGQRTDIERETELTMQIVKECLWGSHQALAGFKNSANLVIYNGNGTKLT